jgi:hypothetical protein
MPVINGLFEAAAKIRDNLPFFLRREGSFVLLFLGVCSGRPGLIGRAS